MANLGNFDANQVEPASWFDPVPPGDYKVQIVKSDLQGTKTGGTMLVLEMDILEGAAQGRKLFDRLSLVNANAKAQEIAQRTLSAICHAVGVMQVSDSEQLHFKPFIASVKIEGDNRDAHLPFEQQRMRNAIKGYKAASAAKAAAKPPAAAVKATTAQAPAPADAPTDAPPAAAGGWPPGKKSA